MKTFEEFLAEEDAFHMPKFKPNVKTEGEYITLVKKNGEHIARIPEAERTYKICVAAIKQTNMAQSFIPDRFMDARIKKIIADWVKDEPVGYDKYGVPL